MVCLRAVSIIAAFLTTGSVLVLAAPALSQSTAFYASANTGTNRSVRFNSLLELSDGTVVVGGSIGDAEQFAAFAQRVSPSSRFVLQAPAGAIVNNLGTGRVGFLLHLSSDLSQPLDVVSFPAGVVEDIRHIKATNAVGTRTGVLFISGTLKNNRVYGGGYFIARLDNNYVKYNAVPRSLTWARTIDASGDYVTNQPWDVGSDGRVVYVSGQPFAASWCAVGRLKAADCADDVVENWRYHRSVCTAPTTMPDGTVLKAGDTYEGEYTPASGIPNLRPLFSQIVFKSTNRIQLRSWTQAEYAAVLPDGNGRMKRGTWPMDVFYSGPGNAAKPSSSPGGPGYTGYRVGASATQRIGGIAVDRRTNHFYIGFSIQSRLPDGNPDFEPAVMAMTQTGALKWWSRLYAEQSADGQTPLLSTPDQYVDGLAIDNTTGSVVVLARCHGNNVSNLWSGNTVAAYPSLGAFHSQFTGTSGNIHISWLGKLNLDTGTLGCATYVADYAAGMSGTNASAPYTDPNLDGWPSHNAGWPELNTTRCETDVKVDVLGRVYLMGKGRRVITTANALQKMSKNPTDISAWSSWVRVFSPRFETLVYSSLLSGQWDNAGVGGDNTALSGVYPVSGGLILGGWHKASSGIASGNPIPTINVPWWGSSLPDGETGILARFAF